MPRRELLLIVVVPLLVGMASGTTLCAHSRENAGICGAKPIPATVVPAPKTVAETSQQDFTPVGCGDTYKLLITYQIADDGSASVAKTIDAHLASLGWTKPPACGTDYCRLSNKENVIIAITLAAGDTRARVTASPLHGKNIDNAGFGREMLRCARLAH